MFDEYHKNVSDDIKKNWFDLKNDIFVSGVYDLDLLRMMGHWGSEKNWILIPICLRIYV